MIGGEGESCFLTAGSLEPARSSGKWVQKNSIKGGSMMAIWKCQDCGWEKDTRCKPKKCGSCGGSNIQKKE